MSAAELSRVFLGEDIAVALRVRGPEEGRDDLQRELIEPRELGPESREANVNVELEELNGRNVVCERFPARRLSGRGHVGLALCGGVENGLRPSTLFCLSAQDENFVSIPPRGQEGT
jgi:hypothetical protein